MWALGKRPIHQADGFKNLKILAVVVVLQRFGSLESSPLAVIIEVKCVCGESMWEEGCRGMSVLANDGRKARDGIPFWEWYYQQHLYCGFPSAHQSPSEPAFSTELLPPAIQLHWP